MLPTSSIIKSTVAIGFLAATTTLFAGPLNPPFGSVASTNKTLTEVEPRIAINLTNTPGDNNSRFKITQPGSYYLAGNLSAVTGHGIEIAASNVTIDLMGFQVVGSSLTADGITTEGLQNNITIRNGTVSNWGSDGINLTTGGSGAGVVFESVIASDNGGFGIRAGSRVVMSRCIARSNTGDGINISSRAVVTDCVAAVNARGIVVGAGSAVSGCSATDNTGPGFTVVSSSTIDRCTAASNAGEGFVLAQDSSITGCIASNNANHGIALTNRCSATDNTSTSNTSADSFAAGIYSTGDQNQIARNRCTANNIGISIASGSQSIIDGNTCWGSSPGTVEIAVSIGASALIYRNMAQKHGNANPYSLAIVPLGVMSPIDLSVTVWVVTPGADHPWANFYR